MKLKKQLTLKDILKLAHIDYEGVEQAIIDLAEDSEDETEFIAKFANYFDQAGLGGDDCYNDTQALLRLFIDYEKPKYSKGDVIRCKGNSGLIYQGTIKEILDDDLFLVSIFSRDGLQDIEVEKSRLVE